MYILMFFLSYNFIFTNYPIIYFYIPGHRAWNDNQLRDKDWGSKYDPYKPIGTAEWKINFVAAIKLLSAANT